MWASGTGPERQGLVAASPFFDASKTATWRGRRRAVWPGNVLSDRFRLLGQGHRNDPAVQRLGGAGAAVSGLGVGADGELRNSYGFIGQVTLTPANSKVTLAGSYGSSWLKATNGEADFKTKNSLISGGIYFQATKSLKVVGEGDYAWTKEEVAADTEEQDVCRSLRPDVVLLIPLADTAVYDGLPATEAVAFPVPLSVYISATSPTLEPSMHHRVICDGRSSPRRLWRASGDTGHRRNLGRLRKRPSTASSSS